MTVGRAEFPRMRVPSAAGIVAGAAVAAACVLLPVTAAAWRSTRFTFRRASGRSLEDALAWEGDHDLETVLEPPVPPHGSAPDDEPPSSGEDPGIASDRATGPQA